MQKISNFPLFLALLIISCALTTGVEAQTEDRTSEEESPWYLDLNVAFNSDYMFRGQNLYDGASIQPYIAAGYDTGFGTIGAYNWMHISADGATNVEEYFEMDWGVTYELELEPVTITFGHLWYTYPNDNDDIEDTAEFYGALALDDSGFNEFFAINPTLTIYRDYDLLDYTYYEFTLSHTWENGELGEGVSLTPYVTMGFASDSEKVYEDDGLVQVTEGISVSLPLGGLTVTPAINYTHEVDDFTQNEFWFGVTLGYSM